MNSSGLLLLDVDKIAVDGDGVRGFSWPVSRAEVTAVRDVTLFNLISVIRTMSQRNYDHSYAVRAFLPAFVSEVGSLFQAQALVRRASTHGLKPVGTRARFIDALIRHSPIPEPPIVGLLTRGIGSRNARKSARRALGDMRRSWGLNAPSFAALRPFNSTRDIMTIQSNTSLIRVHARLTPSFVRYKHPERWFLPLEAVPDIHESEDGLEWADELLAAAAQGFAAGNEQITADHVVYLRNWLVNSVSLVAHRMAALRAEPNQLPKVLWTGNGVNTWNRILRHAVRLEGGKVTGHDHGVGTSHLHGDIASTMDFEACDTFVTFTDKGAAALQSKLQPDLLLNDITPEVISLGAKASERGPDLHRVLAGNSPATSMRRPIKAIMYPSSFYTGGFSAGYSLGLPDVVALDWEARLFSKLRGWGFEVLHKPHPASVSLPKSLAESFGGRTLTDRFEQVMEQADAFILLNPQSTVTPLLLASPKPTVYVEAGLYPLTSEATALMSRRCAIVHGWIDDDNRIQVEWDELHSAIDESWNRRDTSIVDHYWLGAH